MLQQHKRLAPDQLKWKRDQERTREGCPALGCQDLESTHSLTKSKSSNVKSRPQGASEGSMSNRRSEKSFTYSCLWVCITSRSRPLIELCERQEKKDHSHIRCEAIFTLNMQNTRSIPNSRFIGEPTTTDNRCTRKAMLVALCVCKQSSPQRTRAQEHVTPECSNSRKTTWPSHPYQH